MSALETVDDITAVASEITAALKSAASSGGGDETCGIGSRAVAAGGVSAIPEGAARDTLATLMGYLESGVNQHIPDVGWSSVAMNDSVLVEREGGIGFAKEGPVKKIMLLCSKTAVTRKLSCM